MKVRKLVMVGVLLLVSIFVFLLWMGRIKVKEKSYESLYSFLSIQKLSPPVKATDFTLENLEGVKVSLKDFKGKAVFLNFWATWCGPCQWEMPAMEKLWQKFKNDKFVIIAVNIREGKEMVKSFMKEKGYTFPVLLDSKGEVARTYGIRAIPTTFLIDVEGKIMGKAIGARDWAGRDVFELIKYLTSKR